MRDPKFSSPKFWALDAWPRILAKPGGVLTPPYLPRGSPPFKVQSLENEIKKSKERRNEYQEKGRKNSEKLEVRRIKVDAKVEQGVTNKEKGEAKVRTGVRTKKHTSGHPEH